MSTNATELIEDIPVRNPAYRLDDDLLVSPERPDEAIYVSRTAALVWNLCDGRTSVSELVELLAGAFPENGAELREDIVEAIQALVGQGALYLKD